MTARSMGLASGVDTAETVRLLLSLFMQPAVSGALNRRTGLVPYAGSGDLTGVTPMVGRVAPLIGWIDGTTSGIQGGYPVILDANEDLTFDNGEAGVGRVDRVIGQIEDNTYDASGFQRIRVRIVKGQASGAANAVPASSIPLWEVTVPANASVGGGGFTMSSARSDKRVWTTGLGGILNVKDGTDLATLTPYVGMQVFRLDADAMMKYTSAGWKWDQFLSAEKSSDTDTNVNPNGLNLVDATQMALTFPPGGSFALDGFLIYAAHSSADLGVAWSYSGTGAFLSWNAIGKESSQGVGATAPVYWGMLSLGNTAVLGGDNTNNTNHMTANLTGRIYTGTGGTLQMRVAQGTNNATKSILFQESWLKAWRIG